MPYEQITTIENELPKCIKRPTLIVVTDDKLYEVADLSDKYPQSRLVANSSVEIKHPSVCISLSTDREILELVKRLRDRNNEVDQRRMEQEMRRLSREEEEVIGYSMTLALKTLSQKIMIFSSLSRNTNIKNMVEKYNSTRVRFIEYASLEDLKQKLFELARDPTENIVILIGNDEEIDQV